MVEEILMLASSVGLTLFLFGLFSEYHFFIVIGLFLCCVSMLIAEIYLD